MNQRLFTRLRCCVHVCYVHVRVCMHICIYYWNNVSASWRWTNNNTLGEFRADNIALFKMEYRWNTIFITLLFFLVSRHYRWMGWNVIYTFPGDLSQYIKQLLCNNVHFLLCIHMQIRHYLIKCALIYIHYQNLALYQTWFKIIFISLTY